MVPMIPAAVSLFGAPLANAASAASVSTALPNLSGAGGPPMAAASPTASPAPFADLLTEAVGQLEHYEAQAKSAIEGLISGQGVDVHEAMIASQKAAMGFELVLAVRNKALAAYQQVMGLQF